MSKATILALVDELSVGLADANLIDDYFYDIMHDLGDHEILLDIVMQDVTPGTAVYTIPEDSVKLFGVFYGERFLNRVGVQELEAFAGINWRDVSGNPYAFVTEDENERDFRLFPNPDVATDAMMFPNGLPFGIDYPREAMGVVISHHRDDTPGWLELPVTFEILAREFARESDHKDTDFAAICREASRTFFAMAGVKYGG